MKRFLPLLVLFLLAPLASAQSRFDLTSVDWTMRPDVSGESIAMEMSLAPLRERDRVLLRLPWWRPGSYNLSNYQRAISNLTVVDQEGAERGVLALDDRTWEVDARGATALTARYDLATSNSADEGEMPAVHLHSPSAFLYTEDTLRMPHTLRFELPDGWDHASGHRPHPLQEGVYYSPDYDVFVDCPIVVGGMERHAFELRGKPFEVVLWGKLPSTSQLDREDWVDRVRRISDAGWQVMGDFPFERYVYLFGFTDIGGGYGLEHLNSTTIEFNHRLVKSGNLEPLESVTAHEFIHLWNVKRIRPEQLGPFDYSTDVRTRDLWWMEGITSYYNDVMLQRAGLRGEGSEWFLASQVRNRNNLAFSQGYGNISAERASWTVWDGRQRVSYYDQGQALGWLLDVQIRHHTGNQRSLDDVMRVLARWVDYPGPGLEPDDLERMVKAVTGWDCSAFFDRYVAGNLTYPYAEVLPLAGLQVLEWALGDPYLGLGMDAELTLTPRPEDSGLFRDGDRLLAVAGQPVDSTDQVRLVTAGLVPDSEIELTVLREGAEVAVPWTVKERTQSFFSVREDPEATAKQRAIREGILTGTPQAI